MLVEKLAIRLAKAGEHTAITLDGWVQRRIVTRANPNETVGNDRTTVSTPSKGSNPADVPRLVLVSFYLPVGWGSALQTDRIARVISPSHRPIGGENTALS